MCRSVERPKEEDTELLQQITINGCIAPEREVDYTMATENPSSN